MYSGMRAEVLALPRISRARALVASAFTRLPLTKARLHLGTGATVHMWIDDPDAVLELDRVVKPDDMTKWQMTLETTDSRMGSLPSLAAAIMVTYGEFREILEATAASGEMAMPSPDDCRMTVCKRTKMSLP